MLFETGEWPPQALRSLEGNWEEWMEIEVSPIGGMGKGREGDHMVASVFRVK